MDLHKLFDESQEKASNLQKSYQTAFEETDYHLVMQPPQEKQTIITSQDGVEISHNWDTIDHIYKPNEINCRIKANLSKLTPQKILQHFSETTGRWLEADYQLKIPLKRLKKYPTLSEAIELRKQEEGRKLKELIELVEPVTDMKRHFSADYLERLKKKVVYNMPHIDIRSSGGGGETVQGAADDIIQERIEIEKLRKEEKIAKASLEILSDPIHADQRAIVEKRLRQIISNRMCAIPPSVRFLKASKENIFCDGRDEIEAKLERPYGDIEFKLNVFPSEPFVRVYEQSLRAKPNFYIPETAENSILPNPSSMKTGSSYGKGLSRSGLITLSWPLWTGAEKGPKVKTSVTSVNADFFGADDKSTEKVLADMEQVINNLGERIIVNRKQNS